MTFSMLAAAAAEAVSEPSGGGFEWKSLALVAGGMLLMRLLSWVSGWLDGKGKVWIDERFSKLQDKLNDNGVLAQLSLDDALITIARDAVPEVLNEIADTVKQNLKDGKFDAIDWEELGGRLWSRIRLQVEGGKNDYIKNSSFSDGRVLAVWVIKKYFTKEKAIKEGVIHP